jgi:3-dehydroquinate synthase
MNPQKIKVEFERRGDSYEIAVGYGLLAGVGAWARRSVGTAARKIAIVSNKKVFGLYGEQVEKSLASEGFDVSVTLIGDGERFKSLKTAESLLRSLSENKFSRTDAVLALGGGVVGDLAGFAASVYLRGVSYLQVPTTFLAMIDSSVGGKTGVNSAYGKNLYGTLFQPRGVLADIATLDSLPEREVTAGICEAIKQGAVAGRELFDLTASVLNERVGHGDPTKGKLLSPRSFQSLIASHIAFKAAITAGDELESVENKGRRSRKILNFGHTLAHALEKVTNYRYLKHGEAVGYGIIFATELSKNLELLPSNQVTLLNDVVRLAGKLPPIAQLEPSGIATALQFDKKIVGGSLQWVLLRGIGKPVIFPDKDLPRTMLHKTIESFLLAHGRK